MSLDKFIDAEQKQPIITDNNPELSTQTIERPDCIGTPEGCEPDFFSVYQCPFIDECVSNNGVIETERQPPNILTERKDEQLISDEHIQVLSDELENAKERVKEEIKKDVEQLKENFDG